MLGNFKHKFFFKGKIRAKSLITSFSSDLSNINFLVKVNIQWGGQFLYIISRNVEKSPTIKSPPLGYPYLFRKPFLSTPTIMVFPKSPYF